MILIACLNCGLGIRVMPTRVTDPRSIQEVHQMVGENSTFWPDQFKCPRCGNPARGMLERKADPKAVALLELRDLTPHEAFQAFNDLGLPEEQDCSLATVQQLLGEQPVRGIIGTDVMGMKRTIVDALELWDGTKIYFGAGAEGACIYRIVKPVSATQRVLTEGSKA
jgi:hypothetical protein